MYLTGFADEASQNLGVQIQVTKALGWNAIEARGIWGSNIHDLEEGAFNEACQMLAAAEVHVNCFGSTIANWAKRIEDPFEVTLAEVDRAIPRMKRLGTKLIRIMSYARCKGEEQHAAERFARLRELQARFADAGLTPVHENCMNYGGMSWRHTLELVENVPGLKLVFDTGNPAITLDPAKAGGATQDPLEFYWKVREHVAYVHIKDARLEGDTEIYSYPGEGHGRVPEILTALIEDGYDGGISIEPHMASVFHDPDAATASEDESAAIYAEYGRRLMGLLKEAGATPSPYAA
ncbi:MAG: TIM barrel protein [Rhizobiales bacterium]|nr:TIM barrel protein [Hyphomicrobiales bacterium]